MKEQLAQELEKIGLSEKEAKVYLASLELGTSTAQTIAAKATVNRPTTYIMIESLIKRGLMSSFEKGKKRFFVAGKPTQLLYILENKKRLLGEQEKIIATLIENIGMISNKTKIGASVIVYEGIEAIGIIQEELKHFKGELLELVPIDIVRKYIPPIFPGDVRENFHKLFTIKSLYTNISGPLSLKKSGVEYRYLPHDQFPIRAEVLIFSDKVVISTFDAAPVYYHINSADVFLTIKTMFIALWDSAAKYQN